MSYPTPAPENYDHGQTIKVSPVQIEQYATSLNTTIDSINTRMDKISATWKGLTLGWAGTTKTEVDGFNAQWLSAVTEMFGVPKTDPYDKKVPSEPEKVPPEGQAALGKIQALVKAAASTYATAEDSLCENLLQYGDDLPGGAHKYDKNNLPDGKDLPAHIPKGKDTGGTDDGSRDFTDAPIKEHNEKK
ncbi:MAG TPA: WXG100 family type VII secretion target [Actinocatenispora sp.]